MKRWVLLISGVFAAVLAVVVGKRMSAEAMAVVIGVVCGVAASIPTSLLVVWALGQRQERQRESQGMAGYPPVVIVQGGLPAPYGMGSYNPPATLRTTQPRHFTILGTEDEPAYDNRDF